MSDHKRITVCVTEDNLVRINLPNGGYLDFTPKTSTILAKELISKTSIAIIKRRQMEKVDAL